MDINDLISRIFEYAPSPSYAFDNADQDNVPETKDDVSFRKKKGPTKKRIPFDLDGDEARAYRNRSVPPSFLPDWHVPHSNKRVSEE